MNISRSTCAVFVYAALMLVLCYSIYSRVVEKEVLDRRTDIRAQFDDASLLVAGVNPYSRLSNPDLPQDRITFYFPGFLLASSAAILAGADSYETWLGGWRAVSMLFHVAVGTLIFILIRQQGSVLGAIIGSSLWFVSRWPLSLYRSGQIDGPAICFLLLSLLLLSERRYVSAVLFSLSLAVKQMAVFLFPLYLLWAYQDARPGERLRSVMTTGVLCVALPALLCLPFFIWSPDDFIATTLFPLTRAATEPQAIHAFLGLEGVKRKIPFFVVLVLVYAACARSRITRYQQVALVLFVLLGFTNTFFSRHFNWLLPFLMIVLTRTFERGDAGAPSRSN